MARFYTTFSGEASEYLGIGSDSPGNRFDYVAMNNGTTRRTNLINARNALSTAMYGQIDDVRENGNDKWVIPRDVISFSAGNLNWSNIYKNDYAIWQENPKTRPFSTVSPVGTITVANSFGAPSPADSGAVTEGLYYNAVDALEAALNDIVGGGPKTRRATLYPLQTLASLFNDHSLTYLAWDDFTPGTASNLIVQSVTYDLQNAISVYLIWNNQFLADSEGQVDVLYQLSNTSNGQQFSGSQTVSQGEDPGVTINISTSGLSDGTYNVTCNVRFRDPTFTDSTGSLSPSATKFNAFVINSGGGGNPL